MELEDFTELGYNTSKLDEADMERIANEMCDYYLDSCTFSEDLCAATDTFGVKMRQ